MRSVHHPDFFRCLFLAHSDRCNLERTYAHSPENLGTRSALKPGFRYADHRDFGIQGLIEMLSKSRLIPKHHITVNEHHIRSQVDLLKQSENAWKLASIKLSRNVVSRSN
jgi:hypothetical protein